MSNYIPPPPPPSYYGPPPLTQKDRDGYKKVRWAAISAVVIGWVALITLGSLGDPEPHNTQAVSAPVSTTRNTPTTERATTTTTTTQAPTTTTTTTTTTIPGPAANAETDSFNETNPPQADINDDMYCGTDDYGMGSATAHGTLTNRSSETSSYDLEMNYVSADGTILGSDFAFIPNVPPGSTATWEMLGIGAPFEDGTQCVLTVVNRFAA